MRINRVLKIDGTLLDQRQLDNHLEKIASSHNLINKSDKKTYPIPNMMENYKFIAQVYELLNEHLKLGITIHPAGEWLLDNFYIIEQTVKQIQKELPLKKYKNFVGISNGKYKGFARIYVLAAEIVAYTDNKIEKRELEECLEAYQTKKTLSMEEIWNIGIFLQIAIIENIKELSERIYASQIQKFKAENIVERLVENKVKSNIICRSAACKIMEKDIMKDMKYPFIEYMSYILKRYAKKGYSYLRVLEETIEMTGTTVSDVIKKEHFDIAVRKVSMGNSITSIKKIQRINFLEIFEKINGVEEILKQDPSNVYIKMDNKTKEYYRNSLKQISKKTKISEMYIAKKVLQIAKENKEGGKKAHIGYYLIDDGINQLYDTLKYREKKQISTSKKSLIYLMTILFFTIIVSYTISSIINISIKSNWILLLSFVIVLIPSSEIVLQIVQYILSKIVKPKLIPKLDYSSGIPEEDATMVIIPTIVNSKEKVQELMRKMEVYYLANKSDNIYFTLLGDCTQSDKREEEFDKEVMNEGNKLVDSLNKKYEKNIFNFMYRKRVWNESENSYLGWERKRGMLVQLNEYLLGNIKNPFRENTLEKTGIPKVKYIITLDADTDLILNSAFELVGAMSHILNEPVISQNKNVVIEGYGILQPRVGVNLDISYKSLFTKIFAGSGGIDSYSNAISDIYQDNFKEGIFIGKGIYNLKVYSVVLKGEIPENTVLSHDLLEGCYVRCGLATDILLMDGYPTKYNSFMNRLSRWTRGDWQIIKWLGNKKINLLSKIKIFDNLRRSLLEISILIGMIYFNIIGIIYNQKIYGAICLLVFVLLLPYILELVNKIIFKRQGEQKQKMFSPKITGIKGAVIRGIISLACFPYKAYSLFKSIIKTIYRMLISHKKLLEWTTSEEAEKQSKSNILSYFNQMSFNVLFGVITVGIGFMKQNIFAVLLGVFFMVTPFGMWYISRKRVKVEAIDKLNHKEKEYVLEIGKKTWSFFEEFLTKENNYLITDNYQEDRKEIIIPRTSSTNIGLSILAVISAYDLKYINLEKAIDLIENIIKTVEELPKWNGHLYNWYNIKTKEPLIPRYVSTVDSGNFVGYLYVTKMFLEEINKEKYKELIDKIQRIINNTDFSYLYSKEQQIFSIGFNIEENRLTDSYYDLLASEARQASLVAIAKKDVPVKHWNYLSRTLTILGKYKGLISWSGTAFEYLMPNINIPTYEGSLLDESCKFLIKSQIEYSKYLKIPFGISEAAFNIKDLKSNYQYKAFGIPWLGLKRGLADELVVSSYAGLLALTEVPKEELENLKVLEQKEMYGKYGFYESIDYTPERLERGTEYSVVKTYMAHHQGLILLSINNFFNNNVLQKRFVRNPEIDAVSILLQETMPETFITTNDKKEKVEKLKYKDYENYVQNTYKSIEEKFDIGNVVSNENYTIAMNQKGEGVSRYKDIDINKFKPTKDYSQGIFFTIKSLKTKTIISSNYAFNENREGKYQVSFMPDKMEQEIRNNNLKVDIKTTVSSSEPVEIRRIIIENQGNEEEILEVTSYFEPVLSRKEQDYAHPAFNNLFLTMKYDDKSNSLIVKRKPRDNFVPKVSIATTLSTNSEIIGDLEYELEEEKFIGRGNLGIPNMVKYSIPLSKRTGMVTEPIVAIKRTIKVKPGIKAIVDFILSVGEKEDEVISNLEKYKSQENVKKEFQLSKARVEAESIYLRMKGSEIEIYQRILSYLIFTSPLSNKRKEKVNQQMNFKQSDLWKYGISGDLPIILVKMKDVNDAYVLKEVLKAYEFFRLKNVGVEIVILDEEKHSYENYLKEEIEGAILNNQMSYLKNQKGGIFTLVKSEIEKKDIQLLEFLADVMVESNKGGLKNSIKEIEEKYIYSVKDIEEEPKNLLVLEDDQEDIDILANKEDIKYYNEYGAFSPNGKEYFITLNKVNRLPTVWSHILANEKFGTVLTENMGGYTWYKNSRLNRISTWENNPSHDLPTEVIYLKDNDNQKSWSLGLNPKPDDKSYNIIYGFGYAKYIHLSDGIEQELEVFIPKEDSCKIQLLKLKNTTQNKKKIKIYYYVRPTLGEDDLKTNGYIDLRFDKNANILYAQNRYKDEMENTICYVSCSESINSYTGDKKFFLGKNGLKDPRALRLVRLNNVNSLGRQPCIAYEVQVEIDSFSTKEISIVLGAEDNLIDCKNIAYKYQKITNCNQEFNRVKNDWKEKLEKLQVYTPLESTNILLNGWMVYQTIASRLLGRSGYYQSGGAFGFRDQLQDTLGLKYLDPEYMKKQIIKHSKHQFVEGDVEHWWHDETGRGIRTRFSDDLLWIPYLVIEYINFTGDYTILDIETSYKQAPLLQDGQDEKYDKYEESTEQGSIYEHCIKAIEKSFNFGENGLPKIGSGDWNDGFSTVGNKGKGESVWLGFFLYNVLDGFSKIIEKYEPDNGNEKIEKYKNIQNELKRSLNTKAWDGRWYKRAFMDDGNTLGSMENEECKIDSIAQSWSIISNAGDNDKKYISMESLENHLIDKENGIIKLLDPPFEKSKLEPGYIKAYLPGVRENGGQYTHSSCWVIIAEAMLGFGEKALELYRMINPIEHSRTKDASNKYKVEPYVIPADIYGANNLAGRGGWTWYTGSSSWYYKAGIEYILGLKIQEGYLSIFPCIPKDWKEYKIEYKWKNSLYKIVVRNPDNKNCFEEGKSKVILNGNEVENRVKLDGSRNEYKLEVTL